MRGLAVLERHRWLLAIAIAVILVADGWALLRQPTTPVPLAEAVRQFHDDPVGPNPPPTSTPPTVAVLGTTTAPSVTTTRPAAGGNAPETTAPPADGAGAPAASPRVLKPAPGVYRYRTTGSESLSLLGATRAYPTETTRIVRHGMGCVWTMRILLVEEHQEEHTACGTATTLDVTANVTDVEWFGMSFPVRLACDPPIRHVDRSKASGELGRFQCRDVEGDSVFAGTTSVVGEERFVVGAEARPAWRLRLEGNFTGKTRGHVSVTELLDMQTGTVLFEQRVNDLRQTGVLEVSYHQELILVLVSLSPAS